MDTQLSRLHQRASLELGKIFPARDRRLFEGHGFRRLSMTVLVEYSPPLNIANELAAHGDLVSLDVAILDTAHRGSIDRC
jgi:hypothetical protein